jgi:hypothetical protein
VKGNAKKAAYQLQLESVAESIGAIGSMKASCQPAAAKAAAESCRRRENIENMKRSKSQWPSCLSAYRVKSENAGVNGYKA